MSQTGNGVVIQVAMRDDEVLWQAFVGDGKAVVLRGDFNTSRFFVQDRMVGSPVTEFEFKGRGTAGLANS